MINLVVACGGGIFTTTVVTDQVKEILKKEKIDHNITPAKITEIANISGADLIITTGKTSATNKNNIPIMVGISLLTGIGVEDFTEQLLAKIKEIQEAKKHGNS
ncbi:MAG: PTS sorbitol IIB subunit [Peptococcia bacterium]